MTKNYALVAAALGLLVIGQGARDTVYAQKSEAKTTKTAVAVPTKWNVDPMHTSVGFGIRHMGLSVVQGRFNDVSGTIVANAAAPEKSSVEVVIKTTSIDTGVKMRDDHLRAPDFFDAAKYPEIRFRSTQIKPGKNGNFVAVGDLTMRGVTKKIELPFTVNGPIKDPRSGSRFGVETKIRLNRQDFGLSYHQVLDNGALSLANDVDVTIGLEAVPAK